MSQRPPGTPIKGVALGSVAHSFRFEYAYTLGEGHRIFLDGLRRGVILASLCRRCGRRLLPPRSFCEQCFRPIDEWVPVRDEGYVSSYSISYVNTDASRRQEPQLVAVIDLEEPGSGMSLLHVLGEVGPGLVKVGLKVRAVWKPEAQRRGEITDILYFRPEAG
jgi:uncharacterized OB-fold protein